MLIRKCNMSKPMLHRKMRCLVSAFMLHTKICNVYFSFSFSEFGPRHNLDKMINGIWQSLCVDLGKSNVYAKFYQKIPKGSRDIASLMFFRIWTSAKPRPLTNGIGQSLGLHNVNVNVCAKFHHNIPLGSGDWAIVTFSEFGDLHSLCPFAIS